MTVIQKFIRLLLIFTILLASCSGATNGEGTPTVASDSTATNGVTPDDVTPIVAALESRQAEQPVEAEELDESGDTSAENTPPPTNTAAAEPTATDVPAPTPTVEISAESTPASLSTANFTPLYGGAATTIDDPPAFNQILDSSLRMMPLLAEFEASLDRTQFDLNDLSLSLDYDADRAVAFVRDEINFEPYNGILRGAFGTLVSRAGNDVDQAVLLRYLLDDAGYETRVAQATLSEAQVETWLTQISDRSAAPALADNPAVSAVRAQIIAVMGLAVPEVSEGGISAETASDFNFVLDTLTAAGVQFSDGKLADLLIDMQDYYWLQYRLSPFDDWRDAHVAFGSSTIDVQPEITYIEALPTGLHHRLELAVYVERKEGDALKVHQMVRNVAGNSADLFGQPITYVNRPNNLDPLNEPSIETQLEQASIFMPILNGELAGDAFDMAGQAYSMDLLALDTIGALPLFQTVGEQLEDAANAINSLGNEDGDNDLLALTGQWIEYTQITPDNKRTTTRRYIIDRIGEANRDAGVPEIVDGLAEIDAAQQLLTTHTIAVLPGRYSPTYAAHRQLTRMLQEGRLLEHIQANPELATWPAESLGAIEPIFDVTVAQLFDATVPNDILAYRARPTLVIHQEGFAVDRARTTAFERVDVISNQRQVFSIANGAVRAAPEAAVQIGIMETALEPLLLQPTVGDTLRHINTLELMRDAASNGASVLLLLPDDDEALNALPHSDETKRSILHDLEQGYLVLVPSAPAQDDAGADGWWRVNPETGETLGITTGGYGTAYAEYTVVISILFGVIFGVPGVMACQQGGGSLGCCLAFNAGIGLAGFGIGAVLGKTLAVGTAILIFDLGLNAATLTPIIPNVCAG